MSKFSIVIITFNEEQIIERCLKAALKVSDDVIIIDSFSQDKTKEICEKFSVTFIEQKWLGYSAQKNFAIKLLKNDWVLYLDADEVLSDNAIIEYTNLVFDDKNTIYKISRFNNYCGKWIKHGRWYPEWRSRLFHKETAKWNNDLVHEDVEAINNNKVIFKKLKGDVFHYSIQSKKEHLEKVDLYATLSAKKMFDKGRKASLIKRFFSPISRFVVDYFIKLGFLDGKLGYQIAKFSTIETYLKYLKLNELNNNK